MKPKLYRKYYPKLKRSFWMVSHMPKPFRKYAHLSGIWLKAHKWANDQNGGIRIINGLPRSWNDHDKRCT